MANELPSGRWRGRVVDHRTGRQVAPHLILGGPKTYPTRRLAERAEDVRCGERLGVCFDFERGAEGLGAGPAQPVSWYHQQKTCAEVRLGVSVVSPTKRPGTAGAMRRSGDTAVLCGNSPVWFCS